MSRIRSRMRSRLTRSSARASGPPGQVCGPRPKATWFRTLSRSRVELGGALEPSGIAVGGAVEQHHRRPGRDLDAADRGRATGEAEVGLHRALDPQHLLEEARGSGRGPPAARPASRGARPAASARRRAGARSSPGRPRTGTSTSRTTAVTVGRRPVGVRRQREVGRARPGVALAAGPRCTRRTSSSSHASGFSPGLPSSPAPTSPTVPDEPEALAEPLVVGFRHAEQVGDDEHGEGLRVRADELAAAVGDELVELLVGEAPHERLVVLEPLRRDQPHQQRPLAGVVGRVHRDHVLVHRAVGRGSDRRSSLTSSPSSGTGNVAYGPTTELHDENVSGSWYTSLTSS